MSRSSIILCDNCGKDVDDAGSMPSFRLVLHAEPMRNTTGFQYAVHVTPPISGEKHFCNFACLSGWLALRAQPSALESAVPCGLPPDERYYDWSDAKFGPDGR